MNNLKSNRAGLCGGFLLSLSLCLPAPGWSAEEAAHRARELNQLQRQQHQDQLQLKMQQYQRNAQNPPTDTRQRQAIEQLELSQQLRQQQLHQQQQRVLQLRHEQPSDDEGARRAKVQIEQQRAEAEGRRQLQQFDRELQIQAEGGKGKEAGVQPAGAGSPVPGQHVPQ